MRICTQGRYFQNHLTPQVYPQTDSQNTFLKIKDKYWQYIHFLGLHNGTRKANEYTSLDTTPRGLSAWMHAALAGHVIDRKINVLIAWVWGVHFFPLTKFRAVKDARVVSQNIYYVDRCENTKGIKLYYCSLHQKKYGILQNMYINDIQLHYMVPWFRIFLCAILITIVSYY